MRVDTVLLVDGGETTEQTESSARRHDVHYQCQGNGGGPRFPTTHESRTAMSRKCCRIMLGKGSIFAPQCFEGGFIGTDFGIHVNLTGRLPDQWRAFNREFIPIFLETNPDRTEEPNQDRSRPRLWCSLDG